MIINILYIRNFFQDYKGSVLESASKGTPVLNVSAIDGDNLKGNEGFGDIRYYLTGENAVLFSIDPMTGQIIVSKIINLVIKLTNTFQ